MSALVQQTKEWVEFRKNNIGASDASIIMGVSPWKTPFQLWKEKTGLKKSDESTPSMRRGLELEPKAREAFQMKMGLNFHPSVVIHPTIKWMIASLDGINDSIRAVLEIKCVRKEDHELAKSGKIPEKYYPQIQHQLEVSGYDRGYYYSFDGEDGVIVEYERDDKYIDQMVSEEKAFYKCMTQMTAPELSIRDYKEAPSGWKLAVEELESLAPYLKREQELRDYIIEIANGENVRGNGWKLTQVTRKGTIDYSKIPELQQIDLEKYRKAPVLYSKLSKEI